MLAAAALLCFMLSSPEYAIVLENGRAVRVADAPRREGNVVLSLLADGTLVSLSASRVDWPATRARTELVEGPLRAAAPGQRKPKRQTTATVSNRTIRAYSENTPPLGVPVTGATSSVTELPGPVTVEAQPVVRELLDNNGRGPEYWRERAQLLNQQTRAAERLVDAARKALVAEQDALLYGQVTGSPDSPVKVVRYSYSAEELALNRLRISQLGEKVREREAIVEEARQREADLVEEARLAGARPGWLRLPVAYR